MRRRVSGSAREDIAAILTWSSDRFGADGRRRYEHLIAAGMTAITAPDPVANSHVAGDVAPGVRLFHLRHAPRTGPVPVRRPRHVLVYRVDGDLVVVLRLLHDAMDLPARLAGELPG